MGLHYYGPGLGRRHKGEPVVDGWAARRHGERSGNAADGAQALLHAGAADGRAQRAGPSCKERQTTDNENARHAMLCQLGNNRIGQRKVARAPRPRATGAGRCAKLSLSARQSPSRSGKSTSPSILSRIDSLAGSRVFSRKNLPGVGRMLHVVDRLGPREAADTHRRPVGVEQVVGRVATRALPVPIRPVGVRWAADVGAAQRLHRGDASRRAVRQVLVRAHPVRRAVPGRHHEEVRLGSASLQNERQTKVN